MDLRPVYGVARVEVRLMTQTLTSNEGGRRSDRHSNLSADIVENAPLDLAARILRLSG